MKSIIGNLAVDNCQAALEFYQGVFGGEVKNTQLADDVEMFKGHEGKYIHSELHINESCILYLTDVFASTHVAGNNFQLVLEMSSEEEITIAFEKLAESGQVSFPLGDTFWGAKHGVVKDRFDITWGLNFTNKQ